jgi:hypothetical protein
MKKITVCGCMLAMGFVTAAQGQEKTPELPSYLKDRGTGIPTSMFGTYLSKRQIIVYPFYEYYYDNNAEYKPSELGYDSENDYRGHFRSHEGLLFLGYGISDRLNIEMEAALFSTATLYKSNDDNSSMPQKLKESGLGDVEGQLRWRWVTETMRRPEIFSYFETVFPFQKQRKIIGTQAWEFALGTGLIKGFNWGTVTVRGALGYSTDGSKIEPSEYAVEYLKYLSKWFRLGVIVEGEQDEVSLIADMQFHISKTVFIRVNNGFGLTSKSPDYTPEIGVAFYF